MFFWLLLHFELPDLLLAVLEFLVLEQSEAFIFFVFISLPPVFSMLPKTQNISARLIVFFVLFFPFTFLTEHT